MRVRPLSDRAGPNCGTKPPYSTPCKSVCKQLSPLLQSLLIDCIHFDKRKWSFYPLFATPTAQAAHRGEGNQPNCTGLRHSTYAGQTRAVHAAQITDAGGVGDGAQSPLPGEGHVDE